METISASLYLPFACFQAASLWLLYFYRDAVVLWHVAAAIVLGFVCAHLTSNEAEERTVLRKSPKFTWYFSPLMFCEVVCTNVVPWILLMLDMGNKRIHHATNDSYNSPLFVPHLFFFQEQIAFELLILSQGGKVRALYNYTALANALRSLIIAEWWWRSQWSSSILLSMTTLLVIGSNLFIVFVWRTCLVQDTIKKTG